MDSPITGKSMKLLKEKRKLTFRKENFDIVFHHYLCEDSGEMFESEEQAELNVSQVYNKYREKHNLPFPEEIRLIRQKYGLSASRMSEVLGFGVNTYRNYENGEVPSISNARLLQLANDPNEFLNLVNLSGVFNKTDLEKIVKRINLIIDEKKNPFYSFEEFLIGSGPPSELNGYMRLDVQKLYNIISFFTEHVNPWKTQLNKLMFYSDFLHFKKYCNSITGLNYRAIPLGPVPNQFDMIFSLAEKNGYCEFEYNYFDQNSPGVRFIPVPNTIFNKELFSNEEISTLNIVLETFGCINTSTIIKMSHKEKGWIESQEKKSLINYYYSFDLVNI